MATWSVEPAHSTVGFSVRKLGHGLVHGRFADFEGTLAGGTVRVASIDTGDGKRDAHLRAPGFFGADDHPLIGFRVDRLEADGEQPWRITGELTIRGRTRPLALVAVAEGDGERRRLHVTGELDRRDFGLTWNRAVEASGAVGTKIGLELDLELSRRPG